MNAKEDHTKILLGSMHKMFREARRKGNFSARDLFFLNCIYKTISFACEIKMTQEERKQLVIFYFKILGSSSKFCVQEFSSDYHKDIGKIDKTYIQTKEFGDFNPPTVSDNTITL